MLVNNFNNSIILGFIFSNSILLIYFASNNKSNQYSVSLASFSEIDNLCIKSALLCACSDSLIFAQLMSQNEAIALIKQTLFLPLKVYKDRQFQLQIKMIFL